MAKWTITIDDDVYTAVPEDGGDNVSYALLKGSERLTLKALARAVYLQDRARFGVEPNVLSILGESDAARAVRSLCGALKSEGF